MMNCLAIGLLLTTLATAGVFSPTPEKQKQDVIVKEGHRSVMVEYETDGGSNTKVLISPEEGHDLNLGLKEKISQKAEGVKEKLKDTVFPDQEDESKENIGHRVTPRELVCDAFGKCKHKLASAFGKTKEKAYEMEEEAKEAVGKFKDKVSETAYEAKEKVKESISEVSDKSHQAKEEAKEKAEQFKEGAKEKLKDGKEKAERKTEELKEGAKEKLKKGAEDVIDSTKKVTEEIKINESEMMEETKRKGKEAEEKFKNNTYKIKEEGKKEMNEILHRGGEVIHDAFIYMISSENVGSAIRIMDLFGFSMAFGMAMWVTFISSYVLAGALPRQQFGMVQSKIYPVYFRAMSYSIGMVVVADFLSRRKKSAASAAEMLQGFSLVGSLFMVLANLWYLEPRATKVMFERMKLEKEETRGIGSATAEPGTKVADRAADTVTTRATTTGTTTTVPSTTMPSTTAQEKADGATAGDGARAGAELVRLSEQLKRLNSLSSYLNILTLMCLTWRLVHLGQRLQMVC